MSYRVELSPSARAGCTNGECNKEKIKIPKGDLRAGVLITIQDKQSFKWRHWGCVTPAMLSNMKLKTENNLDYLDGYEELPSELQEKVARAFEQGHVDDGDWKGDLSQNRPGAKGFRSPAPKKRKEVEDGSGGDHEEPVKATKKKKRARAEANEDEVEAPVPKKTKVPRKKSKIESDDHEEAADEAPKPAPKGKGKDKKKVEIDDEDHLSSENIEELDQSPVVPTKKPRAPRKKAMEADDETEGATHASDQAPVKAKPKGRKKVKTNGTEDSPATAKSNAPRKSSRTKG